MSERVTGKWNFLIQALLVTTWTTVRPYDTGSDRCGSILLPHGTRDMASTPSIRSRTDSS